MTVDYVDRSEPGTLLVIEWTLTAADEGKALRIGAYGDKSYFMWGTFGGTVTIQGSGDGGGTPEAGSWMTLHETDNTTPIAMTAAACGVILENPVWIRPIAGAGVSSVKVSITATWRRNM